MCKVALKVDFSSKRLGSSDRSPRILSQIPQQQRRAREEMKLDLVLVATGAVGGAILRHSVSEYGKARAQGPAAILCVNVVGSFALGAVSAAAAPRSYH